MFTTFTFSFRRGSADFPLNQNDQDKIKYMEN